MPTPAAASPSKTTLASGGTIANPQVAECCFEYLATEIVRTYLLDNSSEQHEQGSSKRSQSIAAVENIGFEMGYRYAERTALERPRFVTTLDVIRFTCKEVWNATFGKQIDKLQTDHRGVYVLHDTNFRWLARIPNQARDPASGTVTNQSDTVADMLMVLPCGMLRGVFTNLGIPCKVTVDTTRSPYCIFTVNVLQSA